MTCAPIVLSRWWAKVWRTSLLRNGSRDFYQESRNTTLVTEKDWSESILLYCWAIAQKGHTKNGPSSTHGCNILGAPTHHLCIQVYSRKKHEEAWKQWNQMDSANQRSAGQSKTTLELMKSIKNDIPSRWLLHRHIGLLHAKEHLQWLWMPECKQSFPSAPQ